MLNVYYVIKIIDIKDIGQDDYINSNTLDVLITYVTQRFDQLNYFYFIMRFVPKTQIYFVVLVNRKSKTLSSFFMIVVN